MEPELKVTVFWGDILYDTTLCKANSKVTIGKNADNTFLLDLPNSAGAASLELVKVNADRSAELQFDDSIDGHVRFGGELLTLHALKHSARASRDQNGFYHVKLSASDRADLVIGHVSFYLDWVNSHEKLPATKLVNAQNLTFTLIFLCVLGAVLWLVPYTKPKVVVDAPPERLVAIIQRKLPPPPPPVVIPPPIAPAAPLAPTKAALGEKKTKDGGAAKGAKGKAELTKPKIAKNAKPAKKVKVAEGAIKHKLAVGNTAAPSAEGAWTGKLGNVVKGLQAVGGEAPSVATGKGEGAPINQTGTGGFTTEGMKTGGGGGKSIGIGRTTGQGEGGFEGTGRLGLGGKALVEGGSGNVRAPGSTTSDGGLDREVIDSIIRRRQDRIRLCYERQLNFNPNLSGKITVAFTIGPKGAVQKADLAEDTMKNAAVTSCVLREVKSWSFPPPRGGTLVKVDYPFVFESSGRR